METYIVTFVQEKQFFLGNPTVKVMIDDKMVCELKLKTGDSAKVRIPYGKHRLTLTGSGKRLDRDFFVSAEGTINLRWDKTWGKPEIADIGEFDLVENISTTIAETDNRLVSVILNGGGAEISIIQMIREVTGATLKEAQQMYNRKPCVVKKNISKSEAVVVKAKFEQLGAVVILDEDGSQITVSDDKNLPVDIAFGITRTVGNYLWINENKNTVGIPKTNFLGTVIGVNSPWALQETLLNGNKSCIIRNICDMYGIEKIVNAAIVGGVEFCLQKYVL